MASGAEGGGAELGLDGSTRAVSAKGPSVGQRRLRLDGGFPNGRNGFASSVSVSPSPSGDFNQMQTAMLAG